MGRYIDKDTNQVIHAFYWDGNIKTLKKNVPFYDRLMFFKVNKKFPTLSIRAPYDKNNYCRDGDYVICSKYGYWSCTYGIFNHECIKDNEQNKKKLHYKINVNPDASKDKFMEKETKQDIKSMRNINGPIDTYKIMKFLGITNDDNKNNDNITKLRLSKFQKFVEHCLLTLYKIHDFVNKHLIIVYCLLILWIVFAFITSISKGFIGNYILTLFGLVLIVAGIHLGFKVDKEEHSIISELFKCDVVIIIGIILLLVVVI